MGEGERISILYFWKHTHKINKNILITCQWTIEILAVLARIHPIGLVQSSSLSKRIWIWFVTICVFLSSFFHLLSSFCCVRSYYRAELLFSSFSIIVCSHWLFEMAFYICECLFAMCAFAQTTSHCCASICFLVFFSSSLVVITSSSSM